MARFFGILVLVAAVVVGVAWYCGWLQLSTDRTNGDPSYTVTVDKEKIKVDEGRAQQKLQDIEHKVQEKVAPATHP